MRSEPDQIARDLAQRALSSIDAHERVCTERAKQAVEWRAQASETFARIEKSIDEHQKRLWWAFGGVFTGMFMVVLAVYAKGHI